MTGKKIVIKHAFLWFIFMLCISSGKAQSLAGTYVFDNKVSVTKLIFSDTHFREQTQKDGYNFLGEGTYSMNKDKLILSYTKAFNKDSSTYRLKYTDKFSNEYSGVVSVSVMADSVSYPATITFTDSLNKPVSGLQTDAHGKTKLFIYNGTPVKAIEISAVAFETVTLPIALFIRKISDLEVNLKVQTKNIYRPEVVVECQVISSSKDNILLQNGNNQPQLFKKEKPDGKL